MADISQFPAKGQKGDGDELPVLFGEGDADDGDEQQGGADKMNQGDLPAEEYEPDQVQNQIERAIGLWGGDHFLAKWRQVGSANPDGLDAEGNADDGDAPDQAADEVAQAGKEPAEDEPEDVSETTHEKCLRAW